MKTITKKLNGRAFNAILQGKKNIEIRPNKDEFSENSIESLKTDDIIIFTNNDTKEQLQAIVERMTRYESIRDLLTIEGTEYTLSSTDDLEEGIRSIESIPGYKELIEKNGVFAIKLKSIKEI